VLISALFAAIYKILPDKRIAWRDVAVGSVVTAILFTIGKSLIRIIFRKQQWCIELWSGWGAAHHTLSVYYSTKIFLLGAEYTRAYAEAGGSHNPE
jgi:membrane protein